MGSSWRRAGINDLDDTRGRKDADPAYKQAYRCDKIETVSEVIVSLCGENKN